MANYFCEECGEPSRSTDFDMSVCCHAEMVVTESNEPRLDSRYTITKWRPAWHD